MTIKSLILISGLTIILTIPLVLNPSLWNRSDAIVHLGIINTIIRNGIPPQNPFLAGEGLPYYWFYNALVAGISLITGAGAAGLMALLNAAALFLLLAGVYLIARGREGKGAWPAVLLAGFGLNGWGWFLLILPLFRYGIGFIPGILDRGVWGFLPQVVFTRWEGTMGFMAGKFLVAGSFGPGLALMTLNYYLLLNYLRRPDRLRALSFLAGIISGAYLNLIIGGIFLVIALAVFLLELGRKKTGAATGLLLVLLAGGVVYPYLASILGASDPQGQKLILRVPGWFQFRTLMTILLPGWIMAGITWRRTRDKNIRLIRLSAGLALFVLVSIYLFIYFPRHNEYKIPYLMSVFLAVITGINYRRIGIKTRRLVGVLILLTLPTTVLALIAYSRDDTAFSPTEPETLLYQKIRNELPEETVVIAEKNTFLAPVLGEREAYLARRDFLRSLSLDRKFINRRRALLKSLWEGNDAPGVLRKIQEEIKRPVALVTYSDRPEFQRKLERHSSSGQPTLWMGTDTGGRPPFYKKWSDYRQDEDDRSQAGNDQTEIIR